MHGFGSWGPQNGLAIRESRCSPDYLEKFTKNRFHQVFGHYILTGFENPRCERIEQQELSVANNILYGL